MTILNTTRILALSALASLTACSEITRVLPGSRSTQISRPDSRPKR